MASARRREIKSSSRYDDCIMGDEADKLIEMNEKALNPQNEVPKPHEQVDGKTNNVTFTTDPEKLETWKKAIVEVFGNENVETLKNGTVMKINTKIRKEKCTVNINFYQTGSVVIQGLKSAQFSENYFQKIKDEAQKITNASLEQSTKGTSVNIDKISNPAPEQPQIGPLCSSDIIDDSITSVKEATAGDTRNSDNTISDDTITFDEKVYVQTSTPIIISPKEKAAKYSLTLSTKLENINTTMSTLEISFKSLVEMLADLRSATNDLSPNIATCLSQQLTTIKRSWKDQIENFEHKIEHCNQTVESLHTKSNLVDNQLKKLDGYIISNKETLNENNVMLKSIGDVIENIDARLCQIEQMKQIAYEEEPFVERQKETSLNVREKTQVKGTFSPHEKPLPQNCDVLILSDSILRRIVPRKFTPRGRTIKQFIGGGASTCRDFVSNFGQNFEPKKVLINIGTRDVQTPSKGVKEKEFEDLFATVVKTWPHSVIYFLPLINRKDIDNATIHASNKAILRSDRTGKINFTKPFLADENMFYDKVHLNDKIGLPALVKHLKLELEMRQASNRNETVNDSFLRSPKNYKPNQSAERQIQSPQPPWPTYNPPPYPWYPPLQNRHFNAVPWFPPPPPPPPFWGLPWSTPQQNFVKG